MCTGNDCLDTSTITIPTGQTGAAGANGINGTNGTNGQDGNFGGFSAKYLFDATTGGAPATTFLKFNSTTLSAVSSISVNDLNADSTNHDSFLASFVNPVNGVNQFGLLRIWKRFNSNIFWAGSINAHSDLGTSRTFGVTHIQSNGTFTANDEVIISFVPSGDSGSLDKEVLYSNHIPISTTSATSTLLDSYSVPANTLAANGDQLVVNTMLVKTGGIPSALHARIRIAGEQLTTGNVPWLLNSGVNQVAIKATITRVSSTAVFVNMESHFISSTGGLQPAFAYGKQIVWNSATANLLEVLGNSADGLGNAITLQEFVIKKFDI